MSKPWASPDGLIYTLPTEVQWEYACRAGTTGSYAGDLAWISWYDGNAGGKKTSSGSEGCQCWGLYDMHGNVFEWCLDYYEDYPAESVDPKGASWGPGRVNRGGSWGSSAKLARSVDRNGNSEVLRASTRGFRLALVPSA